MLEKKRISFKKTKNFNSTFNENEKKILLNIRKDNQKPKTKFSSKTFVNETKTLESRKETDNIAGASKTVTTSGDNFSKKEKSKENKKIFVVFTKFEGNIKSSENSIKEFDKKIKGEMLEENKIKVLIGNYSLLQSFNKSHEMVIFPSELKSFKNYAASPTNTNKVERSKINDFEKSLKEKIDCQMKFVIYEKERHKKEYYRSKFGINLLE
jgi:hypothetical protein